MDFSKIYRALMLMNDNLRLSKPLLNRNLVFKVFKRNKNIGWNDIHINHAHQIKAYSPAKLRLRLEIFLLFSFSPDNDR